VLSAVVFPVVETLSVRAAYGNAPVMRPRDATHGPITRFGPHASWKDHPLLRGSNHR
jgi:hypothetical protein